MPGVSRDEIATFLSKGEGTEQQRRLAELRLEYSEFSTLRSTFLKSLRGKERIFPVVLPTQVTGRWSYLKPPLSGFPKRCINPDHPKSHHRKVEDCWSVRDCILPDPGTFWIEHDLDAVEHRVYCLILGWKERLDDLQSGIDIHTPVTCALFSLPLPTNLLDPHRSDLDAEWRKLVDWRGKDDARRTLSKNFTFGGQYAYVRLSRYKERTRKPYRIFQGLWYNPTYVYTIPNIQQYKVLNAEGELVTPDFEQLACRFVESNVEIQKRKAVEMERCRKDKFARNLYGGIRRAYFQNQDAAKELFNSKVQGTVASYINESAILLQKEFPDSYLVHNQHDSLKWSFQYSSQYSSRHASKEAEETEVLERVKKLCQRTLLFGEYEIPITATFKVVRAPEEL